MSIIEEFSRLDPKECVSDFGSDHLWVWAILLKDANPADDEWVRCSRCERRAPADLVSK